MITLCYAAKGGSGTTLVACARTLESEHPALLVDFEGDVPSVLGIAENDRPGVLDWLSSAAPSEHLSELVTEIDRDHSLLAARSAAHDRRTADPFITICADRWALLAEWMIELADTDDTAIVIDAGTTAVPDVVAERCDERLLVTRPCYLSLRRAPQRGVNPTGVVLIDEPGRSLRRADVERAAGAPVVAIIGWDPRIARAIDAGLLLGGRLPQRTRRALRHAAA